MMLPKSAERCRVARSVDLSPQMAHGSTNENIKMLIDV
jgi:hypothetical protein